MPVLEVPMLHGKYDLEWNMVDYMYVDPKQSTSSGPNINTPSTSSEQNMFGEPSTCSGLQISSDSTLTKRGTQKLKSIRLKPVVIEEPPTNSGAKISSDSTWRKSEPQKLKSNPSKPLVVEDRKQSKASTITTKLSQWAAAKTSIEEFKRTRLEEEYKLKLDLLRQESDARVAMIKEDQKAKTKLRILGTQPNLTKEQVNEIFKKISDME
ncbi:uncharacterized protein LOC126884542 [Diabrotica virgifera virgifera]|uniref:Uncharacterized protein n=1 Tax=Diabrotica virgifera virgifera TaxID=50390 RepID=A0ABM5K8E7_DIAVI|nr:uncharacterized protein LOC126884542 [Diabrotica virgifera virgifera]